MSNVMDHFKKMQEQKTQRAQGTGDSMFYQWTDEQIVRLIGDFIQTKIHWINNGMGQKVKLYGDSIFSEKKLPVNINCANWDIKEEKRKDGGCIVCKLNNIARAMLRSEGNSMSKEERDEIDNLKRKTDDRTQYRFNGIVRGFKGVKLLSCGNDLLNEIGQVQKSYQPKIISSMEEGVDIRIARTKGVNQTTYSASIVLLAGASAAITPLTAEEKEWKLIDLYDFCGKLPDQKVLLDLLDPKWKDLIVASEDFEKSKKEEKGKAPF